MRTAFRSSSGFRAGHSPRLFDRCDRVRTGEPTRLRPGAVQRTIAPGLLRTDPHHTGQASPEASKPAPHTSDQQSGKPFPGHARGRALFAVRDEPIEWRLRIEKNLARDMKFHMLEQPGGHGNLGSVLGAVKDVGSAPSAKAALGKGGRPIDDERIAADGRSGSLERHPRSAIPPQATRAVTDTDIAHRARQTNGNGTAQTCSAPLVRPHRPRHSKIPPADR